MKKEEFKKGEIIIYKTQDKNVRNADLSGKDKQIISRLLSEYSKTFTSLYKYDKNKKDE
ncbi:MAG: hypothetical protein AABY32_05805 [Nanoarchaeota archaeon]